MINIHSIEQFDTLPQDVMQGFEEGIYMSPCLDSNEILRDLHEKDMCDGIEYLIKTIGIDDTFAIMAEQFKAVSGMEIRL